jgi:four helix bundle protein
VTEIAAYKLEVYRRSEELLNRVYPALNNYPRHEKFSLVSEIKNCFYSLISNIALGDSIKSKRKGYLQEADGNLQVLKVLFKLSLRRRYVSKGFYRDIDDELSQIGKMLGAYIRASAKPE